MSLARRIIPSLNMTANARRGGPTRGGVARGRPARPMAPHRASGCAELADTKFLVQRWSRLLKHWHSRQYNHGLIRRRPTVWAVDRNVGQFRGAVMPIDLFTVRNLKAASGLAFCLALLPATSHAFTQDDQRRLCTSDVFRLCASEIPSVERITACMHKQRASLSEGCRRVFGKPAEQSASAK